jgi:pyruvate/2-oxoglutarate dehydrogenase complex dihydrolipoamide acyltransferase (E2) component
MTHTVKRYPNSRVATFDVGKIGKRKHHIAGLVEADVTLARKRIRDSIKSGEKISFTSWIVKVISDSIAENRSVQAINYGRGKQVVFDDVDISVPIEREVRGIKVPLVGVIRSSDKKSIADIHYEIETMKGRNVSSEDDYVLSQENSRKLNRIFFGLPQWVRLIVWRILLRNPFSIRKYIGTAMVTNVGMSGNHSGWIIPRSIHNLCIGVGSVCKKPWAFNGKLEIRSILNLTILVDHDVVDGLPAAKFTLTLIKNIEKAYGLR